MTSDSNPSVDALCLVGALSSPEYHELHLSAIAARDAAIARPDSYNHLALQLARILIVSAHPERLPAEIVQSWTARDPAGFQQKLQNHPDLWLIFGQTAGLLLKNMLVRPPICDNVRLSLDQATAASVQHCLLFALKLPKQLRNVASTVITTTAVSPSRVQPLLHITAWTTLWDYLLNHVYEHESSAGVLQVFQKLMEDGPTELPELDKAIPVWIRLLNHQTDDATFQEAALQCLNGAIPVMPAALVAHWDDYMNGLSICASSSNSLLRMWVCKSLVTILSLHAQRLTSHIGNVVPFMLSATAQHPDHQQSEPDNVALEACDFWLVFATHEDIPTIVHETIQGVLPQLIPILCQNMVYSKDQQAELMIDSYDNNEAARPVFHHSRNKNDGYSSDDEGDADDDENEWNLRKCSAASLDALAHLYGGDIVLPILLPVIEVGLADNDPWKQEASILALGAIAEGCQEEMIIHLNTVHPFLMRILAESNIPAPVKTIASWTIGQYAFWVVDQVQSGANGALLAQMTEIFLNCIFDVNPKVQHSCCSAFGTLVEASGDLMAPYLEPVYQSLTRGIFEFSGRTLLCLLDVLGIIADSCGPAIAEQHLPSLYIPPLLKLWDDRAKRDPRDPTLLPLMESLTSIAITARMNYQPYALETFDYSMANIEAVTLLLASESDEPIRNEEEVDPIICATDLLDGLVEGLGGNFCNLINSSQMYGPHFLNVLVSLCKHEVPGVRTSAFALLGDLARYAPTVVQPALPQLLQEAIVNNMDPIHPTTATNAVWAVGEICIKSQGHPDILRPFAATLLRNLIGLLMGNSTVTDADGFTGRGSTIPGLAENAASCMGRLALLDVSFVAPQLPTFLLGWCDGLAKIRDLHERRDGFGGFVKAVYGNPQAIQTSTTNTVDAIVSILFAIVSWHMPEQLPETQSFLHSEYQFCPFPLSETELLKNLQQLVQDLKTSVEPQTWHLVSKGVPVNVRKLLRDVYQL